MIDAYLTLGSTLVVFLLIFLLMIRHPVLAKISFRNFMRKKRQVAIATCGLLIGSAIISSSLVIQDTMEYIFIRDVVEGLDTLDETVTIPSSIAGENAPFPYRFYEALEENLTDEIVDGISPAITAEVSVHVIEKNLSRSGIRILGLNFSIDRAFGSFLARGKETYFDDLMGDEAILNRRASEYLDADPGDTLILFGKKNITLRVRDVVENSGKANYRSGRNIFITLGTAQRLMDMEGMINLIKISNRGGVLDGAGYSDEVESRVKDLLGNATTMDDLGIMTYSEDSYQRSLIVFSMRFFDEKMMDVLTSHPNITSKIDAYATYLYFPYIPGHFDMIRLRGKNGTPHPVPLTCVDFRNDAFGQYTTIEGYARYTSDLKMRNGSYEVYLTNTTSRTTGLNKGDVTTLSILSGGTEVTLSISVKDVVRDTPGSGNGAFPPVFGGGVYLSREGIPGMNYSNIIRYLTPDGRDLERAVKDGVSRAITYASLGFKVDKVKQNGLDDAKKFSEQIGEIFLILGTFSIFSGVILVVNIFLMLAEERKHEMGISRALGMKRLHLIETFVFEGLLYAVIASFAGVITGVLIADAVIYSFGQIFMAENIVTTPVVKVESMLISFSLGSLITIATVTLASVRISRVNIVSAIRDLPERILSSEEKKIQVIGLLCMLAGISATVYSLLTADAIGIAVAPCIAVLGVAMVLNRISHGRVAYIASGAFMILWVIGPFGTAVMDWVGAKESMNLLITAGMLMIAGGIIIVMFSFKEISEGIAGVLSRRRTLRSVARISLSYPMNKRVRTANILTMFSMVIFTITVISMISAMEEDVVRTSIHKLSGGYDLIVSFDPVHAPQDFRETLPSRVPSVRFSDVSGISEVTTRITIRNETILYPVRGVDHEFITTNRYTFKETLPGLEDPCELWSAVEHNSSLVVLDGTFTEGFLQRRGPSIRAHPGDVITLATPIGQEVRLTVAGVMDELFFPGVFASSKFLSRNFPDVKVTAYFLRVVSGGSPGDAARLIETAYVLEGAKVIVVDDLINEILRISRSIMTLVQAFVGVGLIVGIAGLGIVTAREVVERRQEIGILKAIGFTDTMVFKSFLIQISFIILLGIMLGVSLGIVLSWKLYDRYFTGIASFTIPWVNLAIIVLISLGATLLSTIPPAYRASKTPPAEAIRYVE